MGKKKRVPTWDVQPVDESVENGGEWWVFQGRTRVYSAAMPARSQLSSATMRDLYWVAFQVLQSIEAQTNRKTSIVVEANTFSQWPAFRLPDPLPKVAKLAFDLLNHCLHDCDELDPATWDRPADLTAAYLAGQLRSEPDAEIGRTRRRTGEIVAAENANRKWTKTRDEILASLRRMVRRYPGKRRKTHRLNKAAVSLGTTRKTLLDRMEEYGIDDEEWCEESSI